MCVCALVLLLGSRLNKDQVSAALGRFARSRARVPAMPAAEHPLAAGWTASSGDRHVLREPVPRTIDGT